MEDPQAYAPGWDIGSACGTFYCNSDVALVGRLVGDTPVDVPAGSCRDYFAFLFVPLLRQGCNAVYSPHVQACSTRALAEYRQS